MNGLSANCPQWLASRIVEAGGSISFHQYMDWALNDQDHGAYACGRLKIGKEGDFATSPSMGSDFAGLLAVQLVDWLDQLQSRNIYDLPLSLVEFGPGEGHLAFDLVQELSAIRPSIVEQLELVLVEINEGMVSRQKKLLSSISNVPVRWVSLEELQKNPVIGVMVAHEVLDALPVERVVLRHNKLLRQGVRLDYKNSSSSLSFTELPLSTSLEKSLLEVHDSLGINIPPDDAIDGWCSEFHSDLSSWFKKTSEALIYGSLLIIDYALEAHRYYNSSRESGTLISYRNQFSSNEVLQDPGYWDITSHLCIETLNFYAKKNNWNYLGEVRQGQALLALGLAERLFLLQKLPKSQLDTALRRRESLLRLVDPFGLGEFRWLAFEIENDLKINNLKMNLNCKFLSDSP